MESINEIKKFLKGDYKKNKITTILYKMINIDYTKRISINKILNAEIFK